MKEWDINKIKELIQNSSKKTKIYFGCDSERFKKKGKWYARYVTCIVIHKNGNSGCKIFGKVDVEPDYEKNAKKPKMRMMNEVYRVSSLVLELEEVLKDKYFEIHLDINPDVIHGSSIALNEAIGYIKGVHGIIPKVKPNAVAASCGADQFLKKT